MNTHTKLPVAFAPINALSAWELPLRVLDKRSANETRPAVPAVRGKSAGTGFPRRVTFRPGGVANAGVLQNQTRRRRFLATHRTVAHDGPVHIAARFSNDAFLP